MRGRAFALGVVGLFLQLIGGFVLVVMLPIVSMGGNGGFFISQPKENLHASGGRGGIENVCMPKPTCFLEN